MSTASTMIELLLFIAIIIGGVAAYIAFYEIVKAFRGE